MLSVPASFMMERPWSSGGLVPEASTCIHDDVRPLSILVISGTVNLGVGRSQHLPSRPNHRVCLEWNSPFPTA
jgi:hypothetical protein